MLNATDYIDISQYVASTAVIRQLNNFEGFTFGFTFDSTDELPSEVTREVSPYTVVTIATIGALPALYVPDVIYWVEDVRKYMIPQFSPSGFTYNVNIDYSEELTGHSDNLLAEEIMSVLADCDTLSMYWSDSSLLDDTIGSGMVYPIIKAPLYSIFVEKTEEDFMRRYNNIGIRLLLYKGFVDDGGIPTQYPYGSSHEYAYDGTVLDGYNLVWNRPTDNDKCLFPVFHEGWYNMIKQAKEVEMEFAFDSLQVAELNLEKKYMVHGVKYFIKEILVEYPITKPVTLKLIPAR